MPEKPYLNFEFDNFGDGYIALRDIRYIGNDQGFVTYAEVLQVLQRIGYSKAHRPGEMLEKVDSIPIVPMYKDIGWYKSSDINYESLKNPNKDEDIWILSFKDPVKIDKENIHEK